jgi:hypothetical protein
MKRIVASFLTAALFGAIAFAQAPAKPARKQGNTQSPQQEATATISGKTITIYYSAPSLRGRKMFGPDGRVAKDRTAPVWRAGADDATLIRSDADLDIGGLAVPKGDHTLFVLPEPGKWQLIVNKQTGQWGLSYSQAQDLGRVPMKTTKAPSPIETFYIKLTPAGGNKGTLEMGWEDVIASVGFTVK